MSGYLKILRVKSQEAGDLICEMDLPNKEVSELYRKIIKGWLSQLATTDQNNFLQSLLSGDVEEFRSGLMDFMLQVTSVYDVTHKQQEHFYHALMLGATVLLDKNSYQVFSNKESGYGRFDLAIMPKNPQQKQAVILEFKAVKATAELDSALKISAQQALDQIYEKHYTALFEQQGFSENNLLKVGIGFSGKQFALAKG